MCGPAAPSDAAAGVALPPRLYVTNQDDATVSIIDANAAADRTSTFSPGLAERPPLRSGGA
jgi:hypothetical protein